MRTLAIDYGAKRVGLAMSDAGGSWATPLEVLDNDARLPARIAAIVSAEDVRRVVVGLPLNMDGSTGPAARQTAAWARALGLAAQLVFVDERLSSFAAEERLTARRAAGENLTRGRKKQQRDAVAAAGFLQEFLDGRAAAVDAPA